MAYARKIDNEWIELTGPFTAGVGDDALQYPANWLTQSTPTQRAALGIKPIVEPSDYPQNVKVFGTKLVDFNNAPHREYIVEEYTPAEAYDITWERAKAYRAQKLAEGATTPLPGNPRVDTKPEAKTDLVGSAVMAMAYKLDIVPAAIKAIMPAFGIQWTMNDNSNVALDADSMIMVAMLGGIYTTRCHNASQEIRKQLKAKLESGASAQSIFAVDVTAGYPA